MANEIVQTLLIMLTVTFGTLLLIFGGMWAICKALDTKNEDDEDDKI